MHFAVFAELCWREAERRESDGLGFCVEDPVGGIGADPAVIRHAGKGVGREGFVELNAFSGVVILTVVVKKPGADAGVEGDGAVAVSGFCGVAECAPGELPSGHVAGDGVVRTARIDGIGAVEPPAGDSGSVAFCDIFDDSADVKLSV